MSFLDPLYGEISLPDSIVRLQFLPIVQRLRHIRLSNIDSLDMPGIANTSRYEHVVGTSHLASQIGFFHRLNKETASWFQAAALLHDWAILPYGHLIEEASQYLGLNIHHEEKLAQLFEFGGGTSDLGGWDRQLLFGREMGLRRWLASHFGSRAPQVGKLLTDAIRGKGKYGKAIAGTIDVDNLDNLSRVAFHMGLDSDRELPLRIAHSILDCDEYTGLSFSDDGPKLVEEWLQLRERVYSRLMLSRSDFVGKAMIASSAVRAFEIKLLRVDSWTLLDQQLLTTLSTSDDERVSEPVKRWMAGDLWELSPLWWVQGRAPSYNQMHDFNRHISQELGRYYFAYRIADKTSRQLEGSLANGQRFRVGVDRQRWLLGVASPSRKAITAADSKALAIAARNYFKTDDPIPAEASVTKQKSLFG